MMMGMVLMLLLLAAGVESACVVQCYSTDSACRICVNTCDLVPGSTFTSCVKRVIDGRDGFGVGVYPFDQNLDETQCRRYCCDGRTSSFNGYGLNRCDSGESSLVLLLGIVAASLTVFLALIFCVFACSEKLR